MTNGYARAAYDLDTLFRLGAVEGLGDRDLLDRYLTAETATAERAFAVLVDRHGPMVLAVCRRILHEDNDAEDAFQATFLVLIARAGGVRVEGSLGAWLHGVALRTAKRLRAVRAKRRLREAPLEVQPARSDDHPETGLFQVIDEELARLPERYRSAVVACCLEGLTHGEASKRLDVPIGTVRSRLSRGKERLRRGLLRRGFGAGALVPLGSFDLSISANPPQRLVESIAVIANRHFWENPRETTAATVSVVVSALAKGASRAMFWGKIKGIALSLCVLLGASGAYVALGQEGPKPPALRNIVDHNEEKADPFARKPTSQANAESCMKCHLAQQAVADRLEPPEDSAHGDYWTNLDKEPKATTPDSVPKSALTLGELVRKRPELGELDLRGLSFQADLIADRAEPCKYYPLVGNRKLVHKHYRVTIRNGGERAGNIRVFYLSNDYLLECHEKEHPHAAANRPLTFEGRFEDSAPHPVEKPARPKPEERIDALEKKLDQVLKAMSDLKESIKK